MRSWYSGWKTSFNSNRKEDAACQNWTKNSTRCCPIPAAWRRSCSWRSSSPAPSPPSSPLGGLDPQTIARYLPLLQELTRDTSQTTQLLYALRPFLKDGKQDKVERAARLARLITIGKRFLTEGGGLPV